MSVAITGSGRMNEIISYNPATGGEVGRVPIASAATAAKAVVKGREAFGKWRTTLFADRSRLVMKTREVILTQVDEIAHLISAESGKPFGEAIAIFSQFFFDSH